MVGCVLLGVSGWEDVGVILVSACGAVCNIVVGGGGGDVVAAVGDVVAVGVVLLVWLWWWLLLWSGATLRVVVGVA